MSYCINPNCPQPDDPANLHNRICRNCGSELLLQERYQVMRLLSDTSGFGKVYEAYNGAIPKILKVLKQQHNSNPKVVELFQQEAAVLSQLNHPGIPKVDPDGYFQFFPRGSTEPVHCIMMEKIDSLNLKQWMQQQGNHPISEKQALNWLEQLAEILHLVHQKKYFHRDIKPANIMLRSTGQLVLIDFGTARELTYTYLAEVGGVGNVTKISSAGYTPPEQEKGYAVPQSDFYALGRTFVYLLTGKRVTDQTIYDPLNDQFNWRNYAPHISPQLANFIDKLMAPTAAARHKNTQEILDDLANISHPLPVAATNPPRESLTLEQSSTQTQPLRERLSNPKRILSGRRNWLIGGAVALILGVGGYRVWQIYRQDQSPVSAYQEIAIAKTLTGHSSFINDVEIAPDGQTLISASADKTIKIWNLTTGQELRTLKGHFAFVNDVEITPDGQKLISASADRTIKIWDLTTGQELRTINDSGFVNYLAISPDGQKLISASADRTIKVWDLSTGQVMHTLTGHPKEINNFCISPDWQTIATGYASKTITVWNLVTGKRLYTLKGHSGTINWVTIGPDDTTLVSASADQTLKVWNLTTGRELRTLKGHSSFVNYAIANPNGQTVVSASADQTIKVWDRTTGQELQTLKGHSGFVNYLDISQDGTVLMSGSTDKTIKIWDLNTGQAIHTLTGHTEQVARFAISPDWQAIATGSGGKTIRVWQVPK